MRASVLHNIKVLHSFPYLDPHGSGKQGNVAVTSFNLMKTIIGAGIFATPYALNNCGFAFGLALIITMGFLFYFTIMTLVHSAVLTNKTSIQELVKHCFGKWGEAILNIMLFLNTWGCMASYTVIIGDVMPNVMRFLMGSPQTEFMSVFLSRRGQINLICFLIIFPISLARSLAHLGKYSGVALAAIVTIFVSVLAVGPMLPGPFKGSEPISIIKGDGIAGAISVFSFAYVCQHNVMLNYAALKNATPARFAKVTRISLTGAVVFTLTIAMAYLTFREKSKDNILNSFPDSNSVIAVARLLFGMDMMVRRQGPWRCIRRRNNIHQPY